MFRFNEFDITPTVDKVHTGVKATACPSIYIQALESDLSQDITRSYHVSVTTAVSTVAVYVFVPLVTKIILFAELT